MLEMTKRESARLNLRHFLVLFALLIEGFFAGDFGADHFESVFVIGRCEDGAVAISQFFISEVLRLWVSLHEDLIGVISIEDGIELGGSRFVIATVGSARQLFGSEHELDLPGGRFDAPGSQLSTQESWFARHFESHSDAPALVLAYRNAD